MLATKKIIDRLHRMGLLHKDAAEQLVLSPSEFCLKLHNRRPLILEETEKLQTILKTPFHSFNLRDDISQGISLKVIEANLELSIVESSVPFNFC